MAIETGRLNFRFYLILINLNLSSHSWLVTLLTLDSIVYTSLQSQEKTVQTYSYLVLLELY